MAHAALLLAALVSFASAQKFDDAQESVPVEIVTDAQFAQVMKGEKTGKEVRQSPAAQKASEQPEKKPDTPTPDAKTDAPAAPPPTLKQQPVASPVEAKEAPTPPVREAAAPSPAPLPPPEPPKPKSPPPPPPKAQAEPPEEDKPDAEVIAPKPPPRPLLAKVEDAPEPQKKIRPTPPAPPKPPEKPPEAKVEPPKPAPRPPAPPKPDLKLDQVAQLLRDKKTEEPKPAAKPKSAPPEENHAPLDTNLIKALINKDKPQQKASSSPDPVRTASLGTPNGAAPKMTPALLSTWGDVLREHFFHCWDKTGLNNPRHYRALIAFHFRVDGTQSSPAEWLNPSSDPRERSIGESALRVAQTCGPVAVPPALVPYYNEWKNGTAFFNPDDL